MAVRHLYFIFLKKKYRYLGWIVPPTHSLPIKIEQKPLKGKCEAIIFKKKSNQKKALFRATQIGQQIVCATYFHIGFCK